MEMQMKCIYCGSGGPFADEHALSRCLGEFRGFPHLLDRICADCNGDIGKMEEQIGRSGPEAYLRKYLNIEGRATHDKVNPFHRGSAGAKPIDVMARLPESDVNILWEINEGQNTVREVRQIVFIDKNRKSFPIRIHEWMKTTDQLREEIKKQGLDLKSGKYSA